MVAAEPPLVSVVVVHYDQPGDLARTLRALARQTYPRLEVIVVDDGSPTPPRIDGQVDAEAAARPGVVPEGIQLVLLPDRGFRAAAARNAGAARASGEVLCFLDADTAPEPEYVERLTRLPALLPEAVTVGRRLHAAFHAVQADPAAGDIAGGQDATTTTEPSGPSPATAHPDAAADAAHPELTATAHPDLESDTVHTDPATEPPVEVLGPRHGLPEPAWLRDAYAGSRNLLDADQRSYRFMIGAALCCSRWFFAQTGGFDERFDRYGGEDWEWAHRAWTSGAAFAHIPDAIAWHNGPDLAGRALDRADLVRRKNAEALALLDRIGVPGTRLRGLGTAAPDIVADLTAAPAADRTSTAAVAVCADVLLAALPLARVVVDDAHAAALAGDPRISGRTDSTALLDAARVVIRIPRPLTVPRRARSEFASQLQDAVDAVGNGTLGWVRLTPDPAEPPSTLAGGAGTTEILVAAMRAERRRAWRPDAHGFTAETAPAPLLTLPPEPDLEAHLSGWAD
ncbi:glycosyltransferase family 2 protein [Herbiconiux solani]|uniref:glycosyltransferase family 2 protein n=1 Tax=Herbiconiux solani TaxID=661329 RepID=UPI0008267DF3|nr:glycosyltransferase family 2 protein [Herbiconiux solani]